MFLEKFLCLLHFCVTWGCTDSSPVPFPPGTGAQILSLMRGDLPLVSCAAGTALWAGGLLVFLLRWLFWSCLTNSSVCCELLWGKFPVVLDFRGALLLQETGNERQLCVCGAMNDQPKLRNAFFLYPDPCSPSWGS